MDQSDLLTALISALISFFVAWTTMRAESLKGRLSLYSLCIRYFIAITNCVDRATSTLRIDALTKASYVLETKAVLADLELLSQNPYLSDFVFRTPLIQMQIVQLRREIVEHNFQRTLALNIGSIRNMLEAYDLCRPTHWEFWRKENPSTLELVAWIRHLASAT